ncbi:sugar ABC transporter ATP-binding protein, partial [bacterium]|nr:sugar ABC transporter ATP-binding protein [bacterium]
AGVDPARIAELMLGRELSHVYPEKSDSPGEAVLSVDGLGRSGEFEGVSFSARRGWILGIFGLVGSGTDAVCKTLFGIARPDSGTMTLRGEPVRLRSASDAIARGIFLVPGDRRGEGQIAEESVSFNLVLSNLARVTGLGGLVRRKQERDDAWKLVRQLAVKTPSPAETVSLLSGGNQQKVVIGKGLYTDADVYIFQEPTAGVDVGAKASIYELIRELSREKAVIVVGSDCDEVLGLCDHAMALYRGRVAMDRPAADVRLDQMLLCGLTGEDAHA